MQTKCWPGTAQKDQIHPILAFLLPENHLTDIGKQKGGASPGKVVKKVIDALSRGVTKMVAAVDPGKVSGAVDSVKNYSVD